MATRDTSNQDLQLLMKMLQAAMQQQQADMIPSTEVNSNSLTAPPSRQNESDTPSRSEPAPLALAHYSSVDSPEGASEAHQRRDDREEDQPFSQVDQQAPDFRLMNAAQDKLMVVKSLLDAQHQQQQAAFSPQHTPASAMQCSHKGRQYGNGQQVLIEEQPCLNCTCKAAILQCYLRVCPPIVSLEAHKRKLLAAARANDLNQECRMVKDPQHCCPVMKCGAELSSHISSSSTRSPLQLAEGESRQQTSSSQEEQDAAAAAPREQVYANLNTQPNPIINRSLELAADQQTASSLQVVTSVPPQAQLDHLPKLTVINGPAGQRDSILLITSNPHSTTLQRQQAQFLRKHANSSASFAAAIEQHHQNSVVSSAPIIEALLETIYSSASNQLQGLNLQGSCLINGSLYFEGSAVLPEPGHEQQCQYCYCIRQKVMCVKPRCHLIISGCTPKYSNEFACCPTSYTCDSSDSSGGQSLARLTSASSLPQEAHQGYLLPASLSSAFEEALTKVVAKEQQKSQLADEPLTVRQIDGAAVAADQKAEQQKQALQPEERRLLNVLSSLLQNSADKVEVDLREPSLNVTTAPQVTTTPIVPSTHTPIGTTIGPITDPTSTTTTTTTSTTTSKPVTGGPTPEDSEEEEESNEEAEKPTKRPRRKSAINSSSAPTSGQRTTTEQSASSVADFLEPMHKLGPHISSTSSPVGCVENNRNYSVGEQIPTLESCKHCYCGNEGLKECKMVECDLRGAHGCKPITPEGHCCPIRFECPPMGRPNATQATPFKDVTQCKSGMGVEEDCRSGAPLLKSTRFIDEQSEANNKSSGAANLSLTEELNRFIMRIRPNSSSSEPLEGADFGHLPLNSSGQNLSDSLLYELDAASRDRKSDYDSVKPAERPLAAPIPPGMVGIPSIEPEIIGNLAVEAQQGGRSPPSSTLNDELATPYDLSTPTSISSGPNEPPARLSVEYVPKQQAGGQRDMRSANGHVLQANDDRFRALNELLATVDLSAPKASAGSPDEPASSPLPFSVSDDYADLSNDSESEPPSPVTLQSNHNSRPPASESNSSNSSILNASGLPHVRTLRHELRHQFGLNNGTPAVYFDDDNNATSRFSPGSGGASLARQPLELSSPYENSPASEDVATSTASPLQPTTGTPIGVNSDPTISPETSSWLRLLPSWTRSFGQRLSGQDGFQGAASGRDQLENGQPNLSVASLRLVAENSSLANGVGSPATARSHQNPFISMLKSIIATAANSPQEATSSARAANLVMRPLDSVMASESRLGEPGKQSGGQQDGAPETSSSARDEPSSSSSELDIVTAAVPLEPEVFGQTRQAPGAENRELVVKASSSFARRSDVELDGESDPSVGVISGRRQEGSNNENEASVRYFSNVASSSGGAQLVAASPHQSGPAGVVEAQRSKETAAVQPQRSNSLSCFDQTTNKTYQLNERIPKLEDPCRACTCVLGRELCQPLVCPERPAENCREERRPGECCPNYLCGTSNLDAIQHKPQTAGTEAPKVEPNLTAQPVQATPMHHSGPSGRQMMQAQMIGSRPLRLADGQQAVQQGRALHQPTAAQLANGYQIRTGDLESLLPPHLRFRQINANGNNNNLRAQQNGVQQQLFNYDQSRLYFPNHFHNSRPTSQQSIGNANSSPTQQHNVNQPNLAGSSSSFSNQRSSFVPVANSIIRPPILMHPQRFMPNANRRTDVDVGSPPSLNSIQSNPFQAHFANDNKPQQPQQPQQAPAGPTPTMISNFISNNSLGGGQQQQALPQPQPPFLNQFNSMRFPVPTDYSRQQQIVPARPSVSIQPAQESSWKMLSGDKPNRLASPQTTSIGEPISAIRTLQETKQLEAQPAAATNRLQADKILFSRSEPASMAPLATTSSTTQAPPAQHFGLNFDSGFRPISGLQQIPVLLTSSGISAQASNRLETQQETSTTIRYSQPELPPLVVSELPLASSSTSSPFEISTTTAATAAPTTTESSREKSTIRVPAINDVLPPKSPEAATDVARVTPDPSPQTSTSENRPSSPAQSTTHPIPENSTQGLANSSDPQQDSSGSWIDPFAFKVSECEVYGRVYKVGQPIKELSDSCKRCTCTSAGVDCQQEC